MNYNFRKPSNVFFLAGALILLGAGCSSQVATTTNTNVTPTNAPPVAVPTPAPTAPPVATTPPASMVTYFVPQDIPTYMQREAQFSQEGTGADPAASVVYVAYTTTTNPGDDQMRAAAQAAVVSLPAGGGPPHANIVYFKVVGNTAYVMLDIDFNGWAGVSAVEAAIQPVIVKNLEQFQAITSVQFAPAPGDSRDQIQQTLPQQ
ncbi:MAG: hypothetical protein WA001_00165 [Patescibacteria group bacterium]